jgi:hypothetical protein
MLLRVLILLLLWFTTATGQRNIHQRWEDQLERNVSSTGMINYSDWKKEAHALNSYLKALEDHPPQPYWTTTDRKAYWINVYNAATLALVLEHYPLQSIQEIDSPWEIEVFKLSDRALSLKAIENLLLEMGDPRILFTLHRAAVSSPPLSKKPYRSYRLEEQLQAAAINFLNDPTQNQCHKDKSHLSRIFLWFFKDFGGLEQKITLLQKYACTEVDLDTRFSYLPFDWRLNQWL